jgi:hypothetical protein
MHLFRKFILTAAFAGATLPAAHACDSCALYIAEGEGRPGFTASVAEQFTRYGTVWNGANKLPNPVDQFLDSSITQLTVSYATGGPWQLQATLPYIHRSFLRPEHALIERGTVSGIGDATLAARLTAWQHESDRQSVRLGLVAGVEFGTGNADHLGDELGHHFHHHADFPDSGVHGHDLALGSGSTDYVVGADVSWRRGRWFARGSLQDKLRRPGKFGYRMADEIAIEAGLGRFLVLTHERTFSVQALVSSDHKGLDTLGGEAQVDTGLSARYAGLRIAGTVADAWAADAALELPVRLRTTETMVVPDFRLRASATRRF